MAKSKSWPKSNKKVVQAVNVSKPTNIKINKLFCSEEWTKIPSWCTNVQLINWKFFAADIAAKVGLKVNWYVLLHH